jgi:hypothetical protein
VYLAAHGAFLPWFDDAFLSALRLTALDYMERANWISLAPVVGLLQVLQPPDGAAFLNGLYWFSLPVLPIINGVLTVKWLTRESGASLAVPVFAAFYALVSLHLEGSMYWYFSVSLTLTGCLWYAAGLGRWAQRAAAVAATGLAAIAVWFHAGQSFSRTATETLAGVRTWTTTTPLCAGIPRASLRIERADCESYRRLVELLRSEVPREEPIFAIPSDAELYFLAERRNPFRFYNTALAIRSDEDLAAVLKHLAADPPLIVTFRREDKFNNEASARIMEYVRANYRRVETVNGVDVFRRAGGTPF